MRSRKGWGGGRSPGEGSVDWAFAGGYGTLMAVRLVQGAGLGVVAPTVGVIIPEAMPPRLRGRAWGVAGVGQGLGVILALLILPRSLSGKTRPMKSGLP